MVNVYVKVYMCVQCTLTLAVLLFCARFFVAFASSSEVVNTIYAVPVYACVFIFSSEIVNLLRISCQRCWIESSKDSGWAYVRDYLFIALLYFVCHQLSLNAPNDAHIHTTQIKVLFYIRKGLLPQLFLLFRSLSLDIFFSTIFCVCRSLFYSDYFSASHCINLFGVRSFIFHSSPKKEVFIFWMVKNKWKFNYVDFIRCALLHILDIFLIY